MYKQAWEAQWERVLWKKKPYPDNYVPRLFLASLSRNRGFNAQVMSEDVFLTHLNVQQTFSRIPIGTL